MSWKKYFGLVTSAALVGVVAVANGCSSSSSGSVATDGGGTDAIVHKETGGGSGSSSGSAGDDGGDASGGSYDGTTGKQCMGNADCRPAGGPGVNVCTSTGPFTGMSQIFPTPVCLDVQNCDPGTDGNIHFCDGPDDPSSPGVCLTISAGKGICLPQCNFKQDGSAATGCPGKDACLSLGAFATDSTGANTGIGFCQGGCDTDADCASGQKCQTDEGICLAAASVKVVDAGELAPGTGCNSMATPAPACNCIAPTTGLGYCGQFCVTGRTECGAGYVCEANFPLQLIDSTTDATLAGWTKPNPGVGGWCAPTCVVDGGACTLPNSTCQTGTLGGPDCLP